MGLKQGPLLTGRAPVIHKKLPGQDWAPRDGLKQGLLLARPLHPRRRPRQHVHEKARQLRRKGHAKSASVTAGAHYCNLIQRGEGAGQAAVRVRPSR